MSGVAGYLCRFVPNVSHLRQLTLQVAECKWGPEQQQSFDKLKEHLTGDIILVYPNFIDLENYSFVLLIDGAKNGFGAVLTQR
jgi:hypothetical protein